MSQTSREELLKILPEYKARLEEVKADFEHSFGNVLDILKENEDLRRKVFLEIAFHSSQMEWNDSTVPKDARERVRFLEAVGHNAATEHMFNYVADLNNKLDIRFLSALHEKLMGAIMPRTAGTLRDVYVRLSGNYNVSLTRTDKVYDLISELMKDVASEYSYPIEYISQVHASFIKIHPFLDGNGRVGRLLLNAMLLRSGYAPVLIKKEKSYYKAMEVALTQDESRYLTLFLVAKVIDSFELLKQKLSQEQSQ